MVRGFVLETNTPLQHPPHAGSWFQAGQEQDRPLMLDGRSPSWLAGSRKGGSPADSGAVSLGLDVGF